MAVFEILNFNKELINKLFIIGFKADDYRFIELYSEYEQMRGNGDKTTYVVLFLSVKYNVSERKIYDIIKRFGKHCTPHAV